MRATLQCALKDCRPHLHVLIFAVLLVNERLDYAAERRQRLVDDDALFEAIAARVRVFLALAAGEVDEVDLPTANKQADHVFILSPPPPPLQTMFLSLSRSSRLLAFSARIEF